MSTIGEENATNHFRRAALASFGEDGGRRAGCGVQGFERMEEPVLTVSAVTRDEAVPACEYETSGTPHGSELPMHHAARL